jgi:hypothetical protein
MQEKGFLSRPAPGLATDRWADRGLDRAVEGVRVQRQERDRGLAGGKRQDLVNSCQLEVLQRTDGCLCGAD